MATVAITVECMGSPVDRWMPPYDNAKHLKECSTKHTDKIKCCFLSAFPGHSGHVPIPTKYLMRHTIVRQDRTEFKTLSMSFPDHVDASMLLYVVVGAIFACLQPFN